MSTAVVYHCTESTSDIMDFLNQNRLGTGYCGSGRWTEDRGTFRVIVVFYHVSRFRHVPWKDHFYFIYTHARASAKYTAEPTHDLERT